MELKNTLLDFEDSYSSLFMSITIISAVFYILSPQKTLLGIQVEHFCRLVLFPTSRHLSLFGKTCLNDHPLTLFSILPCLAHLPQVFTEPQCPPSTLHCLQLCPVLLLDFRESKWLAQQQSHEPTHFHLFFLLSLLPVLHVPSYTPLLCCWREKYGDRKKAGILCELHTCCSWVALWLLLGTPSNPYLEVPAVRLQ